MKLPLKDKHNLLAMAIVPLIIATILILIKLIGWIVVVPLTIIYAIAGKYNQSLR